MKKNLILAAFACGLGWGQVPSDCKPSSLNIPGAPYRVSTRIIAWLSGCRLRTRTKCRSGWAEATI